MSGEKTEKATPKKRRELRRKGTSARSAELPAGLALLAVVMLLPKAMGRLGSVLQTAMAGILADSWQADLGATGRIAGRALRDAAIVLGPLLAGVAFAATGAAVIVTRQAPNPYVLKPKMERVNPLHGVKRLVSPQIVFELVKAVAKLGLVAAVSVGAWQAGYRTLVGAPVDLYGLLAVVGATMHTLLVRGAFVAVAVGAADAAWSRRRFAKQAKMSKQDLKEEAKAAEGNPHVKGAIRARQAKLSRSRMIAAMADADVVLANPTHLVVALSYDDKSPAPIVVAKGAGVIADRIKVEAARHGIPVIADKPLARALYRAAEVGDPIPTDLYQAVAQVLAMVFAARRTGSRRAA